MLYRHNKTLLLRSEARITMTSKVNTKFSIKSLSQATRNSMFAKPTLAPTGKPFLRKLFKPSSDCCSTKSVSTVATEQEEYHVRFSGKVYVRNILSCNDYTPEEVKACWYTHDETQIIHKYCKKEIRKMNEEEGRSNKFKDTNYCSRGLEGHTTVATTTKMRLRFLAVNAVLDVQMIQWEEGIFDECAIAEIYCRATKSCQKRANIVGLADYRETEAYAEPSRSLLVPPTTKLVLSKICRTPLLLSSYEYILNLLKI
jgi:hypothetical protein